MFGCLGALSFIKNFSHRPLSVFPVAVSPMSPGPPLSLPPWRDAYVAQNTNIINPAVLDYELVLCLVRHEVHHDVNPSLPPDRVCNNATGISAVLLTQQSWLGYELSRSSTAWKRRSRCFQDTAQAVGHLGRCLSACSCLRMERWYCGAQRRICVGKQQCSLPMGHANSILPSRPGSTIPGPGHMRHASTVLREIRGLISPVRSRLLSPRCEEFFNERAVCNGPSLS